MISIKNIRTANLENGIEIMTDTGTETQKQLAGDIYGFLLSKGFICDLEVE